MLEITVPAGELYDEVNEIFINTKEQQLELEHSLLSLSKWESKWCKPFINNKKLTSEETIDYVRCMTITKNVDPNVYLFLTEKNNKAILDYISSPMTATTIRKSPGQEGRRRQLTSELIYYYMISLGIPFECQKWHLSRLLMLIEVCNAENGPSKKMSRKETASSYAALNAARRKQYNSKG